MRLTKQKRAKTGISIIEQDGVLFVDAFAGGASDDVARNSSAPPPHPTPMP